jgi:hypothetical protein
MNARGRPQHPPLAAAFGGGTPVVTTLIDSTGNTFVPAYCLLMAHAGPAVTHK